MLTMDVFARVDGKLARWRLPEPMAVPEAIDAVVQADNPPKPVLALVLKQQEIPEQCDSSTSSPAPQ